MLMPAPSPSPVGAAAAGCTPPVAGEKMGTSPSEASPGCGLASTPWRAAPAACLSPAPASPAVGAAEYALARHYLFQWGGYMLAGTLPTIKTLHPQPVGSTSQIPHPGAAGHSGPASGGRRFHSGRRAPGRSAGRTCPPWRQQSCGDGEGSSRRRRTLSCTGR